MSGKLPLCIVRRKTPVVAKIITDVYETNIAKIPDNARTSSQSQVA